MKILNNNPALQTIAQQAVKSSTSSIKTLSPTSSKKINTTDTASLRSTDANISQQISSQEQIFNKQQLFGALTQLEEAIKTFSQQSSPFEQYIKNSVKELRQKDSEMAQQIAQAQNQSQAIEKVVDLKQKLGIELKKEQREIQIFLVKEQNQQALKKEHISTKDSQQLSQKLAQVKDNPHKSVSQTVARLLNS